jgi:hypothetical protein
VSGVRLGGRESDLSIPECGLAIMHESCALSLLQNHKGGVSQSRRASPFGGLVEVIGAIFRSGQMALATERSRFRG